MMAVNMIQPMFSGVEGVTVARRTSSQSKSAPNVLDRSMLRHAVKKEARADDRTALAYSSPGHRCWSSIRAKDWQDFQRILKETTATGEPKQQSTSTSYMYFSPQLSRASRKSQHKQLATPDSAFYHKQRHRDFQKVEEALHTVHFVKQQKRDDYLSGVPPATLKHQQKRDDYLSGVQHDDSNNRETTAGSIKYKRSENDTMVDKSHESKTAQCRAASCHPSVPGFYVFPKPSDFVPVGGTKLTSVGIDWRYRHLAGNRKTQSALPTVWRSRRASATSIPGTLHRTTCPVTEALIKEGTCVSKIQGKPLGAGQWPVEKVWKRKLDSDRQANALEMARVDIVSEQLKQNELKQLKQQVLVAGSETEDKEDTLWMDAESINRQQDSDDEEVEEEEGGSSLQSD